MFTEGRTPWMAAVVGTTWLLPDFAHAYVGPGAGIAVVSTLGWLLLSIVVAAGALLSWPARRAWRWWTRVALDHAPAVRRAVVVGLDGLDPGLVERFMDAGKLPNMRRLADRGTFSRLATTYPAMSPVAWSTFATGVHPSKHGIFDFLSRDPNGYGPALSSAHVGEAPRHLQLGRFRIPLGKPEVRLLRKGKPFWERLAQSRVPCSILRVPITFPPTPFDGTLLSAMCVPDLQGSQGTFAYYSSRSDDPHAGADADAEDKAYSFVRVELVDGQVRTRIDGPANPLTGTGERLHAALSIRVDAARRAATLSLGDETFELAEGAYSEWISVSFSMGLGLRLRGICRFRLLEAGEHVRIYMSPLHIDPSRPVLPIAHPLVFSVFLAKRLGQFGTLGLAEDTWALNERVLDEDAFLEQAWDFHRERESMFREMVKRTPEGLVTCVFDGTDRIQHMFMRYLDDDHPAARNAPAPGRFASVIEDTYIEMDRMLGRLFEQVDLDDPKNLVLVLSDHGFATFRRGVNLNAWLAANGYLVVREGGDPSKAWLGDVDWSKTRAYAFGLGGIYVNIRGREPQGIVEPGEEAHGLADELAAALAGLRDEAAGGVAIRQCHVAHRIYDGPYADEAPDVIVGYATGWRVSWAGARGVVAGELFNDNDKAWSGDHCIDPELVPGVLIANHKLGSRDPIPSIADIAPTVLDLFGVRAPKNMDGRSLVPS
ncbi:MAG: nucleotide pyrophosphatase [Myxococcales bacterium FL481]|nr:MAG: nucleotide pyrophosphatase [Myxococcales bacterium FL481]